MIVHSVQKDKSMDALVTLKIGYCDFSALQSGLSVPSRPTKSEESSIYSVGNVGCLSCSLLQHAISLTSSNSKRRPSKRVALGPDKRAIRRSARNPVHDSKDQIPVLHPAPGGNLTRQIPTKSANRNDAQCQLSITVAHAASFCFALII